MVKMTYRCVLHNICWKNLRETDTTQCPIQTGSDEVRSILWAFLCEFWPHESKVEQAYIINLISEISICQLLHSPCFFTYRSNFFKITCNNPRTIRGSVKTSQEIPRNMPEICFWIPIKISKTEKKKILQQNKNIKMTKKIA